MALFATSNHQKFVQNKRAYALYELAYTAVDFAAAVLFIVGSILFFDPARQTAGTWCFLVGSFFFAAKPTLRILREIYFFSQGDYTDILTGKPGKK